MVADASGQTFSHSSTVLPSPLANLNLKPLLLPLSHSLPSAPGVGYVQQELKGTLHLISSWVFFL